MTVARPAAVRSRTEILSRYPLAVVPFQRRATAIAIIAAVIGIALLGLWRLEFGVGQLLGGLKRLGLLVSLMFPPDPGLRIGTYSAALGETLAISFLGTFTAAIMALPAAMLAAKNVVASRIVHFLARRSLDTIRGIDVLIWALIFINVVGLGPFAGVLAIAISDFGTFGKLFSEAIENADQKPVEGILSAGGTGLHGFRFGVLPQVLPVIASQVLYYFESNTRSATIIGIVGAGGIGLYLANEIQQAEWQHVGFLILMILVTVAAIDWLSTRLRLAIIGRTTLAA